MKEENYSLSPSVVLIIPNEKLLKGISGIFVQKGFTVFPFAHFEKIPAALFSEGNLFVWEVENIKPDQLKWIDFLKDKNSIRFILIDFLADDFLVKLVQNEIDSNRIYRESYKVRDMLTMAEMLFDRKYPFVKPSSYVNRKGKIFARKINHANNYIEEAERLIYDFLIENQLEESIYDIDTFFLALGEVVENFVEHQLIHLNKTPQIIIEYGVDEEKIIISVRDELGEADFSSLFLSFVRKTSIAPPDHPIPGYNEKGIYVGSQGRGMTIIKKGVHRLISIVKRDSDSSIEKRTQFMFILYLDKQLTEENSSVNMLVFF